jgi:hypothetical protein
VVNLVLEMDFRSVLFAIIFLGTVIFIANRKFSFVEIKIVVFHEFDEIL